MDHIKEQNKSYFDSETRADKIVSWSATSESSRVVKATAKKQDTKAKIFQMINMRTGGPGLTNLKKSIKDENDKVARIDLDRLKTHFSSEILEDQ